MEISVRESFKLFGTNVECRIEDLGVLNRNKVVAGSKFKSVVVNYDISINGYDISSLYVINGGEVFAVQSLAFIYLKLRVGFTIIGYVVCKVTAID